MMKQHNGGVFSKDDLLRNLTSQAGRLRTEQVQELSDFVDRLCTMQESAGGGTSTGETQVTILAPIGVEIAVRHFASSPAELLQPATKREASFYRSGSEDQGRTAAPEHRA